MDNDAKQRESKLIDQYKRVFGTDDGKAVLAHLDDTFLWQDGRLMVQAGNGIALGYIDGQRMLMRSIHNKVDKPIDEQLAKFDTVNVIEEGDPLCGQSGYL